MKIFCSEFGESNFKQLLFAALKVFLESEGNKGMREKILEYK